MSSTSNVTCAFIDLATNDVLEKSMYGGEKAIAYFVRETKRATWYTITPVSLSKANGVPGFLTDWSVSVSRSGDYLMNAWLRVKLPQVTLQTTNQFGTNGRIRWTRNFMHNLINECYISFNDVTGARFDSYHLDFWSAFTVPASKMIGYENMIGNLSTLIQPQTTLPERDLNLPLPFFFTRDSGVALPTASLPYNEIRINFSFRDWTSLLILDNTSATGGAQSVVPVVGANSDIAAAPSLSSVQVWAHYAIVSSEERALMGECNCRDILIEQVQTVPKQVYNPISNANPSYDLRLSHNIKVLFFGVRNTTYKNVWSNYTTASPTVTANSVVFEPNSAYDPISTVNITYENTSKFTNVGADYFSLVNPWYFAPSIPPFTGYHMYSYALWFFDVDPTGGTNYGKLTNVSIQPSASKSAIAAANGTGPAGSGADFVQTFEFILSAVSNNIIRIRGGTFGFPIL
ncbi:hypothetical protein AGMMS49579_22150 [Spirochaetia bacterium]|nr:hypothetical protein AGMMS49579_22150 [Spirochaetia bacterium]